MKDRAEKLQNLEEEVIDKTPIAADEKVLGQEDDGFGGFDDEEDEKYMEKAKRNAMRRRGLDPKALEKGKASGETNGKVAETASEKTDKKISAKTGGEKTDGKVKSKKKA